MPSFDHVSLPSMLMPVIEVRCELLDIDPVGSPAGCCLDVVEVAIHRSMQVRSPADASKLVEYVV